jgi:hypothetical protein
MYSMSQMGRQEVYTLSLTEFDPPIEYQSPVAQR